MENEQIEKLAHLAEITIKVLPHGGTYSASEVNELLARQREIIAERIRREFRGKSQGTAGSESAQSENNADSPLATESAQAQKGT